MQLAGQQVGHDGGQTGEEGRQEHADLQRKKEIASPKDMAMRNHAVGENDGTTNTRVWEKVREEVAYKKA